MATLKQQPFLFSIYSFVAFKSAWHCVIFMWEEGERTAIDAYMAVGIAGGGIWVEGFDDGFL